MKITQTIELTIKDQTITLTKEEAQNLVNVIGETLGIKYTSPKAPVQPAVSDEIKKEFERLKKQSEKAKEAPPYVWPQNPYNPVFPPDKTWPSYPQVWCGTLNTNIQ